MRWVPSVLSSGKKEIRLTNFLLFLNHSYSCMNWQGIAGMSFWREKSQFWNLILFTCLSWSFRMDHEMFICSGSILNVIFVPCTSRTITKNSTCLCCFMPENHIDSPTVSSCASILLFSSEKKFQYGHILCNVFTTSMLYVFSPDSFWVMLALTWASNFSSRPVKWLWLCSLSLL